MKKQVKTTSVQLIKYGLVGMSNSLLTFVTIYILNELLGINLYVSDVIGYLVGIINSFIWNKNWVFKSHNHQIKREIILFFGGFLICFGLQLLTVWLMIAFTHVKELSMFGIDKSTFGDYISICVGMVVYTLGNYVYNRFVTFKPKKVTV